MLIKKHNMLYAIGRENNLLKQKIAKMNEGGEGNGETVLHESTAMDQSMLEEIETAMMENADEEDEVIQEHEEDFSKKEQQTKEELKEVDRYIEEREQFL